MSFVVSDKETDWQFDSTSTTSRNSQVHCDSSASREASVCSRSFRCRATRGGVSSISSRGDLREERFGCKLLGGGRAHLQFFFIVSPFSISITAF